MGWRKKVLTQNTGFSIVNMEQSHVLNSLIECHFCISEHKRIVADANWFTAGGCHLFERHFPGDYVRKFLAVRRILHLRIKIREDGRPRVILRVVRVIDTKIFNHDACRHIAGIPKIMLAPIRSTN
jgi:hypothetical protein